MSAELRRVFDDLVRFETDLWNGVDARLKAAGAVPLGSLNVLQVVARTEACRVNEVADALSITIGGASQAVDRLVARELLARRPNPGDRRSSIVELTTAGTEALAAAETVFDAELARWFGEALTGSALRSFARTLSTLRAFAGGHRD
ncbi:MarR family transcriptional regulator [Dactylosporangium vinaceum]|uniref:MarR family winged helix-turn-helix transcriptional regulator n=1 Tax=Dactylosporangium vinaceum TaxID=53362 RepID=A0ABV5M251_9ACTN|nr:MarR family transcriptional regulator [Dactylosporangium vinaceum]UAB99413.1 MarR family transcriptional regulator [Dactylosporangium vinaceum]